MTDDTFNNNCFRHPNVQSNLRCGRCGVLICPQCMMQSPVGARCPDCSKIGQAPIFRANSLEMTTTIALSAIAALGFGAVYALIVWFLLILPFNFQIGNIVASLIFGLAGVPVGEFVRRAGKYKLDSRLRYIAAFTMFLTWLIGTYIATSPLINAPPYLFFNGIIPLIGLAIGIYVAMNRVRP